MFLRVAAGTRQDGEGLVSEQTTLEGVFEGRSRDWSVWGRDWSQNELVLRDCAEGNSWDQSLRVRAG